MSQPIGWRRIALAVVVLGMPASLFAQGVDAGVSIYEEQLRVNLDRQQIRTDGVDAGGWFSLAWFHYDDPGANQWRDLRRYELPAPRSTAASTRPTSAGC
jgi:hypothetical protein